MVNKSNPTRAPTKEEVREYYENNKVSLKKTAEHFDISVNTVKSWKKRDQDKGILWVQLKKGKRVQPSQKSCNQNKTKKEKVNTARAMVIAGATIKEAAHKTALSEDALRKYSAKENWMEQQERFLSHVYSELQNRKGEEHIKRREESIDQLHWIQSITLKKMQTGTLEADELYALNGALKIIRQSIEGQAKLIGIPEMKVNIKKDSSNADKETKKDRKIVIKVVD